MVDMVVEVMADLVAVQGQVRQETVVVMVEVVMGNK
jgi:hypothetical protein